MKHSVEKKRKHPGSRCRAMFLSASYPPATVEVPLFATPVMELSQSSLEVEPTCEEIVSGVRSRRRISEAMCCPVCSCTLRPGELQTHLTLEMDRLTKLTTSPAKRRACTPGTSSNGPSRSDDVDTSGCTGSDVYDRVKRNREKRLRACRGRSETISCPVCSLRLSISNAEVHVDACLKKSSQSNEDDDESIDVEGEESTEESGFGTSYEWCSQVRVRAAALQIQGGGDPPHGALKVRRASTDTHLVVDGDDDDIIYGPPQYSPSRIVPLDNFHYNANISVMETSVDNLESADESHSSSNDNMKPACTSSKGESSTSRKDADICYDIVIKSLKTRIRELEQQLGKNQKVETKCLICIGPYTEPVVSIQCWHVYCENCWLASLGAKKTCPQCNAITTAQHLRRIYM